MSDNPTSCKTSGLSDHAASVDHLRVNWILGTNSMNTGTLSDQWPAAQFHGSGRE